MKLTTLYFAMLSSALAQATLTLQVPGEANTTITFSAEMVPSAESQIKAIGAPNISQVTTTLTAPTLTTDTTFNVAAAGGVKAGMGAMIGTEVSLITAVTATTLTVVRARVGTVAVTSLSGAVVTYLRSGSYGQLVKNELLDWAARVLTNYPGPTITAAQATIATQQAAIAAATTAAVQ